MARCTRFNIMWLVWQADVFLGAPVSSINKIDYHDIHVTEKLLKIVLNTLT